jgi:hypothetical protein
LAIVGDWWLVIGDWVKINLKNPWLLARGRLKRMNTKGFD